MNTRARLILMITGLVWCIGSGAGQTAAIDLELARQYFAEIRSLSDNDSGKLWGVTLYGPTMFVDPATRTVVANRSDPKGKFAINNGVFTGTLGSAVNISNTATELSGITWTMVNWDAIPASDPYARANLLIHESWHRVQGSLGIPAITTANVHLDERDGRIYLRLEFRALRRALLAAESSMRSEAIGDALAFRRFRQSLAPGNNEDAFERHEGLAEYTGLKLCGLPDSLLMRIAARKLEQGEDHDGFANSFAYLTGSALGLLLDAMNPEWRVTLRSGTGLPDLLSEAIGWQNPGTSAQLQNAVNSAGERYGVSKLVAEETERSQEQELAVEGFRRRLTTYGSLQIANNNLNFSFNPMEKLIAFDSTGVIYNTMRLSGDFGVLEVSDGILRTNDWKFFVAVAPDHVTGDSLTWQGYHLQLQSGWQIESIGPRRYVIDKK